MAKSLQKQILEFLKTPRTTEEIAAKVNRTPLAIHQANFRLRKKGLIRKVGRRHVACDPSAPVPTSAKGDKFVELANKRVNNALQHLRRIGNLANRHHYEFSPVQAEKIFEALNSEIQELKLRFAGQIQDRSDFSL